MNFISALSFNRLSFRYYVVGAILVFFLVAEIYFLFFRHGAHFADLSLYQKVAAKILKGQVPYRDFELEYPLFAIIPIVIPEIFSRLVSDTLGSYTFFFGAQNLLFGYLTARLLTKVIPNRMDRPDLCYALLLSLSLPIFLFRYDPFPALLTTVAVYFIQKKPVISGFTFVVSIAAKLYALVLLPPLGLFYLFNKQYKHILMQLAGAFAASVLIAGAFAWIGGNAATEFLSNHLLRGIHIESLSGGILLLLDRSLSLGIGVKHSYGAMHLNGAYTGTALRIVSIITPIIFVALVGYMIMVFIREVRAVGKVSMHTLLIAFTVQILTFIIFNKVFSPQYLVWLFPLIPFCGKRSCIIFTAALLLTVVIFPGYYFDLIGKKMYMIIILNIRNMLLVWLFCDLLGQLGRDQKHSKDLNGVDTGPVSPRSWFHARV